MQAAKANIIAELQSEILRLEGFKPAGIHVSDLGLGKINDAFPHKTFPLGSVHEFLALTLEDAAATCGFLSGLFSSLIGAEGTALWISSCRNIFPPALRMFGVQPDRLIFIDLPGEKNILWAMEEALKCGALTAVIGELKEISFTESRRLQLAVEQSRVTGFILRRNFKGNSTTACVSRWRIKSLASESIDGLPGVGFPSWRVELLRMRNGRSGVWDVKWMNGKFHPVFNLPTTSLEVQRRKAG
jgi:protein ImuA